MAFSPARNSAYCFATALLTIVAGSGCIPHKAVRFRLVVPINFQGLCVMVERADNERHAEPIRVNLSEEGIGYLPVDAPVVHLEGVFRSDGRKLEDLESMARDTEVGYKWIFSTSSAQDWFFIGTRDEYRNLRRQPTHRIGEYTIRF